MSGMEHGLSARFVDRAVANARAIRGAPEAIALVGIVRLGVSYFAPSCTSIGRVLLPSMSK
jgi:hypothetical protein